MTPVLRGGVAGPGTTGPWAAEIDAVRPVPDGRNLRWSSDSEPGAAGLGADETGVQREVEAGTDRFYSFPRR